MYCKPSAANKPAGNSYRNTKRDGQKFKVGNKKRESEGQQNLRQIQQNPVDVAPSVISKTRFRNCLTDRDYTSSRNPTPI
nr:putative integron gene cassette protein [uncultured bacterium]